MTTRQERMIHLATAVKRAGGLVKFARTLGVSLQAISGWKRRGHVPFERATTVEQLYGVPRVSLIHPDTAEAYMTPLNPAMALV